MILTNGRSDYHLRGAFNVRRIVALNHCDSKPLQICNSADVRIAPGYCIASANKELRQRAHSRAGDSDEVDRLRFVWRKRVCHQERINLHVKLRRSSKIMPESN